MEVKPISSREFENATSHLKNKFFSASLWACLHRDGLIHLGVFNKGGLFGTLLLYEYTKLGKTFLIHPPLAPHCGLNLETNTTKSSTYHTQVKRAVRAISDFLTDHYKEAYIDFCMPLDITDAQPFLWANFSVSPRYSYRLNLSLSEEELLNDMSTERRKNIRKGDEQEYSFEFNQDQKALLATLEETAEKGAYKFHKGVLEKLLERDESSHFYLNLKKDAEVRASAVCVYDTEVAYYLSGGHNFQIKDSFAGSSCLWACILEAKKRGCVQFDFLGSSVPDIEKYFRGFGPELVSSNRIMRSKGFIAWLKRQKEKRT